MEILLYLWQLPQNLVGLLFTRFLGAKKQEILKDTQVYKHNKKAFSSVSLGHFLIIKGTQYSETTLKHEYGHHLQSLRLGWLYLLIIGLPSLLGNIYDRTAHKKWTQEQRYLWYYRQPWESWADKLGKVKRK